MCVPDIENGSQPNKESNKSKSKLIILGGTAAAVITGLLVAVIVLASGNNGSDRAESAAEVSVSSIFIIICHFSLCVFDHTWRA